MKPYSAITEKRQRAPFIDSVISLPFRLLLFCEDVAFHFVMPQTLD
jgi:hypothetical protein